MDQASGEAARALYDAIAEERLAEALELVDPGVFSERSSASAAAGLAG